MRNMGDDEQQRSVDIYIGHLHKTNKSRTKERDLSIHNFRPRNDHSDSPPEQVVNAVDLECDRAAAAAAEDEERGSDPI